ncbi:MAG: phosphoribosylformylglycinamidine synthase, partial [bacterium]|nr:phosphoribosylformylglycinamidine synthase [bacterium]
MSALFFVSWSKAAPECPPARKVYIALFRGPDSSGVDAGKKADTLNRLAWLLGAQLCDDGEISGIFVGPRRELVSPWSTNAVDICRSVGIGDILRIEEFTEVLDEATLHYDPMLCRVYRGLAHDSLDVTGTPAAVIDVADIRAFNASEGLALSDEEISFLEATVEQQGRNFTDSELFGFAQINSEHCRHKIFNGEFVIDGAVREKSLFRMIKDTSVTAPDELVSAYKDNVAFFSHSHLDEFAPAEAGSPSLFTLRKRAAVLSLKAETHNFPTTVEPFYGASTGSGGEIRDRMAGGTGSIPLTGTAVYMTSFPRFADDDALEVKDGAPARKWKYQSPEEILLKASNGASDFGNKFGQPLITGSVLTWEGQVAQSDGTAEFLAFDRAVMLAGGVGYAHRDHALKRQ